MRIETLATCHNRKAKTLAVLGDLHRQRLPDWVQLHHTIVDDGSTDGTASSVSARFPDVKILTGEGDLFWAGGMRFGWEKSVKHESFDYLFVYNDDVRLSVDAVQRLLDSALVFLGKEGVMEHAVVGAFQDTECREVTYSGVVRSSRWHRFRFKTVSPPDEGYLKVDSMNMNAVLISKWALEKVGFLSPGFKHGLADMEFGLKLRASQGSVIVSAGFVGTCARNSATGTSMEAGLSWVESFRRFISTKEHPPLERLILCRLHGGWLWPLFWVYPYAVHPLRHAVDQVSCSQGKSE